MPKTRFRINIALGAALCLVATVAFASFSTNGWTWKHPVAPGEGAAGFVRLVVTPELFDGLEPDLCDLRILDPEGNLTPHLVRWDWTAPKTPEHPRRARLFNPTWVPRTHSRVTADFGAPFEKEYISVQLSGMNYCRRALVEGRHGTGPWEMLADGLWLVDIHGQGAYKLDRLRLPRNDFRYLRITVFNMPDDFERITITEVATEPAVAMPEAFPLPVQHMSSSIDEKTGDTVLEIDLGYRHLPLASIALQTDTPLFYRGIQIAGRNSLVSQHRRRTESGWVVTEQETPWQPVRSAVIYRMQEGGDTWLVNKAPLDGVQYRYLRVIIANGDNPPLNIGSVQVERYGADLIFMQEPGLQYILIGGNPEAKPARYDLEKAVPDLDIAALPEVVVGVREPLPQAKEKVPWTERHGWLLWAVLLLAAGILAVLVWANLHRMNIDGSEE